MNTIEMLNMENIEYFKKIRWLFRNSGEMSYGQDGYPACWNPIDYDAIQECREHRTYYSKQY